MEIVSASPWQGVPVKHEEHHCSCTKGIQHFYQLSTPDESLARTKQTWILQHVMYVECFCLTKLDTPRMERFRSLVIVGTLQMLHWLFQLNTNSKWYTFNLIKIGCVAGPVLSVFIIIYGDCL